MAATACCFCGRTVDQVTHLVQGPDLFICDICVDACVDTLAAKDHGWRERQIDYLLRLRNREHWLRPQVPMNILKTEQVGDNE